VASVFVSHSSHDKPFVRRLVNDIRSEGIDVWLDEERLNVGDPLVDSLAEGLRTSDYVLLVVSSAFLDSGWAAVEANAALRASIESRKRSVVPVLLEDVWHRVSPLLRDLIYVDFRERQNVLKYQEGLSRLVSKLSGRPIDRLPATDRSLIVLVTGGRESTSDGRDFDVSYELGRALGGQPLLLRTGIANGVDDSFAKGATEAIQRRGEQPRRILTCYAPRRGGRHHAYGRILESRFESRQQGVPELVTDSDAGIFVGGAKNTMYLGVLMLLEGKPIFPIASTGGSAADLYSLVLSRFDRTFGRGISRDRFFDLADVNLAPVDVASTCRELLEALRAHGVTVT
jgi:hypothetical protein